MRYFIVKFSVVACSLLLLVSVAFSIQPPKKKGKKNILPKHIQQDSLIEKLLKSQPEKFAQVLANPKAHRVQIIYTQINRDSNNVPHFAQHSYRLNPREYFYPASLVKIPTVALSLQKFHELKNPELNKFSRMKIDSANACQSMVTLDSTSNDGYPSIAQYIKKAMLVSDNDAYNRLYEFLGQEYLNKKLWGMGYKTARITNRFWFYCDTLSNRYTNPMTFFNAKGDTIYHQPQQYNPVLYKNPYGKIKVGKGYISYFTGKLVNHPKNYTYSNYLCLQDINDILISLIFPQNVPEKKRFNLTENDYKFLYKYMSMYPRESTYPDYNGKDYKDSFKKYCIFGVCKDSIASDTLRIFNHVGEAHGFLADCAYIVDFKNSIEFFLAAVIYTNKDEIINDGIYEYKTIGMPFLTDLGQLIYENEKNRKKKILPHLEQFKMDY